MGKNAIYCRVSTQQQSTDRQQVELLEFAKNNNIPIEPRNIYIDTISGYSNFADREAYNRLLDDVDKGKIDTILFSEFTRCSRNAVELQQMIKEFQAKNITLFFQKQNLWIRGNNDIGSQILIAVLAVVASYEVELFSQRAVGGKIIKAKEGDHHIGGFAPFGYTNIDKKLVINEEEANIVRKIYNMYIQNKSSIDIAITLNADNIPTSYANRINEEKEYEYNDNIRWRPSTINRLVKNQIYVGKRNFTFFSPDPTNKKKRNERENREILDDFSIENENLRIVSDEIFNEVNNIIEGRKYNKNLGIRHEVFIKHLIKCGHCGGNFGVGNQSNINANIRTYKCYNSISRADKPQTCSDGVQIRQNKIDGLVLQLSLKMFSEINLEKSTETNIIQNENEIQSLQLLLLNKENELQLIIDKHNKLIKRLLLLDDDEEFTKLINEEKTKFENEKNKINNDIEKFKTDINKRKNIIKSLHNLKKNTNFFENQHLLRQDKNLLKQMVDQYIQTIIIYRLNKLWNLVVVKYTTGAELWGTIKSARYKNNEIFYDEIFSRYGEEYISWYIDNTNNEYQFNKDTRLIEYLNNKYDYEEMDNFLKEKDNLISFPVFNYE